MRAAILLLVTGFGLGVATQPAAADDAWRLGDPLRLTPDAAATSDLTLSFTPRRPGVFDLDQARLELALTPTQPYGDRFGADRVEPQASGFAVGGALDFGEIEISGRLVGERGERVSRDGVDAAIGVGPVTTRMSYVEAEGGDQPSTRLGLGAELEAAPGLSLGAGLAIEDEDAAEGERATEGVVRFRLSF